MPPPLLPYFDESSATPEVKEMLGRLPIKLNLFRMMAHAQTSLKPVMRLGTAILAKQKLDAFSRELVLLHAMALQHGDYEWAQHVSIALDVGISNTQIDALKAGRIDADCFDARQRVLLQFTTEVVKQVGASEPTLTALRAFHDPQEIVEIILTIGFYSMMARLTETTRVEIDVDGAPQMVAALQARATKGK